LPYIVIGKGRHLFPSYITDFCLPPSYSKIQQVIGLNKKESKISSNAQADAYISGKVQKTGYRARVVSIARDFGLSGYVQNLDGGRVKVVAEGADFDLESLLSAIDIKNTLIQVADIQEEYSAAANEFQGFFKVVSGSGETDQRIDQAAELLKELISVNKDVLKEIKATRVELGEEIRATRGEVKATRVELKDEIRVTRDDLKAEIVGVRDQVKSSADLLAEKIDSAKEGIAVSIDNIRSD
jgi:acylphosphatase